MEIAIEPNRKFLGARVWHGWIWIREVIEEFLPAEREDALFCALAYNRGWVRS